MKVINDVKNVSARLQLTMVQVAMIALWFSSGGSLALAQKSAQPAFPSAAEASQSLFQAVKSNNEKEVANILGGPAELTSCGEAEQDKVDRELFVQKYQQMHRLSRVAGGSVTLYIGAENWPFPVPLVNEHGAWRFDADAGQKQILFRRIGENELAAVATGLEFAAAEKNYQAGSEDLANSAPTSLAARAASGSTSGDPVLLNGYYFRLLSVPPSKRDARGTVALIAYPAEYRSSGVMTFVVTKSGVIYEKDLGANTSALAGAMPAFRKDATWRIAGE